MKYEKKIDFLWKKLDDLSGNFQDLENFLEGGEDFSWSFSEDLILMSYEKNTPEFKMLVRYKGSDKVEERNQYKELFANQKEKDKE